MEVYFKAKDLLKSLTLIILAQMEQQPLKQTTCTHCGEVFESKGKYQVHYRNNHQAQVKKQDNIIMRSNDNKFSCICGKSYQVYQGLVTHQKSCKTWKDTLEIRMNGEESESTNNSEGKFHQI